MRGLVVKAEVEVERLRAGASGFSASGMGKRTAAAANDGRKESATCLARPFIHVYLQHTNAHAAGIQQPYSATLSVTHTGFFHRIAQDF